MAPAGDAGYAARFLTWLSWTCLGEATVFSYKRALGATLCLAMGIASSSALNDARADARPGTAGWATGRSAGG